MRFQKHFCSLAFPAAAKLDERIVVHRRPT
jgi:hypothetical protein